MSLTNLRLVNYNKYKVSPTEVGHMSLYTRGRHHVSDTGPIQPKVEVKQRQVKGSKYHCPRPLQCVIK